MECKALAENIMKHFKEEQKQKYGDKKVLSLIEPEITTNDKTYDDYSRKDIKHMYNNIVKNPSKYPHMNDWAFQSMKILNIMNEKQLSIDNYVLHIAVRQGFPSIINKVLQFPNIDINSKGYDGRTPLHECLCSMNINMKVLCILIAAGADFSVQDNKGDTPLNIAMLFWNRKGQEWLPLMIMDYLPNYDYTVVNKEGKNMLEYAKLMNCQESVIKKIESKI